MTTPFEHKPPKSADQIRSSLESIHKTAEVEQEPGPLRDGFGSDFQITSGSFLDPMVARDFQEKLSQSGIYSKLVSGQRETRIMVDDEDRHRANEIFQSHRRRNPNRRPKGVSNRFDFLVFGIAVSLTLSFILVADELDHYLALTIPLTFGVIGASLGHVMDRLRMRYRQTGRLEIGVWEYLVLATIPAMVALAWKLLPQILFG